MSKNTSLLTKKELIESIATSQNTSKKLVEEILGDFQKIILIELKKKKEIKLLDLGKIKIKISKSRVAINPKTGIKINVPEKEIPKFGFSKKIKDFIINDEEYPDF